MSLKKLTKKDCGEPISSDEMRLLQLNMLKALAKFSDANGLRYYLSGGTLLGAVRHQGFIPWDDDIDVNMPRPDCETLQKLTKGRLGRYLLLPPNAIPGYQCEAWRIYDMRTVIESTMGNTTKYPIYYPVYMDLFPIEGLPESDSETRLHYAKIQALRKMTRCAALEHPAGKNIFSHLFHAVTLPLAKGVGYETWAEMLQEEALKYQFDACEYVGVVTAWIHTLEEKVIKKDYLPQIDVPFEGSMYHAPANYDTYLRQLYGADYMQLPPEEKRISHHDFKAYWRKRK